MKPVTAVDFAEACITALHRAGSSEGDPIEHVMDGGAYVLNKTRRGWQRNAENFYERDVLAQMKRRGIYEVKGKLVLGAMSKAPKQTKPQQPQATPKAKPPSTPTPRKARPAPAKTARPTIRRRK